MAKRGGKNFKNTVVAALDEAQVEMPVLEQILNGIPIAGDDILAELLDATSDRTVEPAVLAVAEIMAAPGAETPEANLSHPLGAAWFGNSITLCLQSSASTPDGLALGTLGLPEPKMRELVGAAGFTRFQRVPGLTHPVNAYYEVRP